MKMDMDRDIEMKKISQECRPNYLTARTEEPG
jgi:hypothetical protein